MLITDINELLSKVFQQQCYLEDELTSFYQLKFPNLSNIDEFNAIKNNVEKFLSQYEIQTGTMAILYPKDATKHFVLPINKLPLDKFLEKMNALMKDSQLHEAVLSNGVFQVKACIDNGANINNKNIIGDTALHIATRKDYLPIVSLLLKKGALINILNDKGETPLGIADQNNDAIMGKVFIDTRLDPQIEKSELTIQELSADCDERIHKLINSQINHDLVEEAAGEVRSPQRVKQLVQFFFSKTLSGIDQQPPEEVVVTNLVK